MTILPLLALLFSAIKAAPPAVPTITPAELHERMQKGEAVVIDVRGSVPYDLGHIDGAISMPLGLIAGRVGELPQDKLIVAYCSCKREELSDQAVRDLNHHGIEHAAALKGGYDAWVAAGLPVVRQADPDQPPPAAGRLAVPPFVTCGRNDVTAYSGEVISYKRSTGSTVLRIRTDAGTTEQVTVKQPPDSYFVMGSKFSTADWKRIEVKKGKLQPHMRAIAWVCRGGATFVDWRVGEKGPIGD
jgi:rhodanese-related sulfurtransferase